MPVCTLHLLALQPNTTISQFLSLLSTHQKPAPLVVSRVIRWIILPTKIDAATLLAHQWDLLVILEGAQAQLADPLKTHTHASYALQAGIPSSLTTNFATTNARTLHPAAGDVPALTGALARPQISSDNQDLTMSEGLHEWIGSWDPAGKRGAVSMLNLLTFKDGMHGEYLKYGKAFAESIGKNRGGNAKLVGKVVGAGAAAGRKSEWHEIVLAHYPSIWHFADMIASQDYQEVNRKHRVGSLQDTCILFTSELELPDQQTAKSRL